MASDSAIGGGDFRTEGNSGISPTLENQVAIPVAQGLVVAGIGAGFMASVAVATDANFVYKLMPMSGLIGFSWFWFRQTQLYNDILMKVEEFTGKDINLDGVIGEYDDPVDELIKTDDNRLVRIKSNGIYAQGDVTRLALAILGQGARISKRDPVIKQVFGRDSERYLAMYREMRDRGLIIEHPNQPGELTRGGYNYLKAFLPVGMKPLGFREYSDL